MKRLHFFWILLLKILVIQGYGQGIGTPNKALEIRGGLKANQWIQVPDTSYALTCNDTMRIAIVNGKVFNSSRDPITGCAKWKQSGGETSITYDFPSTYIDSLGPDEYLIKILQLIKDSAGAVGFQTRYNGLDTANLLYENLKTVLLKSRGQSWQESLIAIDSGKVQILGNNLVEIGGRFDTPRVTIRIRGFDSPNNTDSIASFNNDGDLVKVARGSLLSFGYGITGNGSSGSPARWDSAAARAQIARVARDSAQFYNVGNTGVRLGQLYQDGFGVSRLIAGTNINITKDLDSSVTISLLGDYITNQYAVKQGKDFYVTRGRADSGRFDSYLNVIGNGTSTQNIFNVQASSLNVAFAVRNDGTSRFGNNYRLYPIASATGLIQLSGNAAKFEANTAADRGFSNIFASRNTRTTDTTGTATPSGNILANENFIVSAGTGEHTQYSARGTINQTGTATGQTQAFLADQTITAAFDYAAVRIRNNTGKGIDQIGTSATNLLAGLTTFSTGLIADKISLNTGANKTVGTATLVAGTVTVNTNKVTTSSLIYVTVNTPGGTVGYLSVPAASIVNGTSFVINSSSNTDTSTVNWWIIN